MPQKEIDIVINDRDIEQSEKKLRKLDKMLQQTQRRAAVLGRARMTPVISLDDRFSTKARLISHRITLLDRMSANPIVWLIDNASAGINKIRDSLSQLTRIPWRVTVSGPNWDVVTGTSFADLLGDESLYTEVGKKAGETYFEAFLSVLDPQRIADILSQVSIANGYQECTGNQGSGSDDKSNGSKGWIEGILDFGKEVAAGLLVDILSKKIGGKMSKLGDTLNKKVTPGKVKDPLKSPPKVSPEVSQNASKVAPKQTPKVTPMAKMKTASKELLQTASEKVSRVSSKVASKIGFKGFPAALESLKDFGGKLSSILATYGKQGKKIIPKVLPFAKGLLSGAGTILAINNTQKYMDNTGLSDTIRSAPKVFWDDLNAPPRTEVNGKPVEDMGVFEYMIELAKENYNRITDKEVWKTYGDIAKTSLKPLISWGNLGTLFFGMDASDEVGKINAEREKKIEQSDAVKGNTTNDFTSNGTNEYINPKERFNQIINSNRFSRPDIPIQFPFNQSAVSGMINTKPEVNNSVNVSVTPGSINLTIQKDEINYDDIAQKTGSMIANQVRFAMMNMS